MAPAPSTYRHGKPNILLRWQTDGVKAMRQLTELHSIRSAARNPDFESRTCLLRCGGAGDESVLAGVTSEPAQVTVDALGGGVMSAVMTGFATGGGYVGNAHTIPRSNERINVLAAESA